jgi:hypothetical protein
MNIHQLSVRYLPEQDRILLSVNTAEGQELSLWLTRRMCLVLWPQLDRMTVDHFAVPSDAVSDGSVDLGALDANTRKVLTDFRRQELIQKADFKTPYRASFGPRPLGQTPLLATEITMTPQTGQQVIIDFKEQIDPSGSSRAVQLSLQPALVFSLVHMLGQALGHTEWLSPVDTSSLPGLTAGNQPTVPTETTDDGILPELGRPRYLN